MRPELSLEQKANLAGEYGTLATEAMYSPVPAAFVFDAARLAAHWALEVLEVQWALYDARGLR